MGSWNTAVVGVVPTLEQQALELHLDGQLPLRVEFTPGNEADGEENRTTIIRGNIRLTYSTHPQSLDLGAYIQNQAAYYNWVKGFQGQRTGNFDWVEHPYDVAQSLKTQETVFNLLTGIFSSGVRMFRNYGTGRPIKRAERESITTCRKQAELITKVHEGIVTDIRGELAVYDSGIFSPMGVQKIGKA